MNFIGDGYGYGYGCRACGGVYGYGCGYVGM